jgi:hypothetical protein
MLRKTTSRLYRLARNRREIRQSLILHDGRYTDHLPSWLLINSLCRGQFSRPGHLAILLIHNRSYKTVLEQSLDWLGIEGYSIVRPHLPKGIWRNTYKIPAALEFVKQCKDEFILSIDSDDAVLMGNPARAMDLLEESGGQALFSTTNHTGYDFMPEIGEHFRREAQAAGWSGSNSIHLNAGVYISRRKPLVEFLESAVKYVTDDEPLWRDYASLPRGSEVHSSFPLACGSEQNIFRFIYPRFAPDLRLDYERRLAFR